MRTSLSFASSSVTVFSANSAMSPMNFSRESSPLLDLGQPVLPVAGQRRRGQRVLAEQADHVQALLGAHQRAAVALDVADRDQALDDRRARGRRADARVLHRLAQLVVVDELAGGLHRAEQRGVGVAPRRLGLLLERLDLAGLARSRPARAWAAAARRPRPPRPRARALVALRGLAVDAAPARHEQHLAARAEDVLRDGRSRRACSRTRPRGGRRRGSAARPCRRSAGRRRSSCRRRARSASG